MSKKIKRHYFISEDLTDLESFQRELEDGGILTQQIHVLTLDTAAADSHEHIHEVHTFMKRDVIHAGEYGFAAGVVAADESSSERSPGRHRPGQAPLAGALPARPQAVVSGRTALSFRRPAPPA